MHIVKIQIKVQTRSVAQKHRFRKNRDGKAAEKTNNSPESIFKLKSFHKAPLFAKTSSFNTITIWAESEQST